MCSPVRRYIQTEQIPSLPSPRKTKLLGTRSSKRHAHFEFFFLSFFLFFTERKHDPSGAWLRTRVQPSGNDAPPLPQAGPAPVCAWRGRDCGGLKGWGARRCAGCGQRLERAPFLCGFWHLPDWFDQRDRRSGRSQRAPGWVPRRSLEQLQTERTLQLPGASQGSGSGASPASGLWSDPCAP